MACLDESINKVNHRIQKKNNMFMQAQNF